MDRKSRFAVRLFKPCDVTTEIEYKNFSLPILFDITLMKTNPFFRLAV